MEDDKPAEINLAASCFVSNVIRFGIMVDEAAYMVECLHKRRPGRALQRDLKEQLGRLEKLLDAQIDLYEAGTWLVKAASQCASGSFHPVIASLASEVFGWASTGLGFVGQQGGTMTIANLVRFPTPDNQVEAWRLREYEYHDRVFALAQFAVGDNPTPPMTQTGTFTNRRIVSLTNLSNKSLNKYARLAGLPIAGKGKRNFQRSREDVIKLCEAIMQHSSTQHDRETAEKAIQLLNRNGN